jgi:hypothetical protein
VGKNGEVQMSTKSLISVVALCVTSPEHLKRISRIDAEDFSQVLAKVKKDAKKNGTAHSEKYLEDGLLGLKQYYAIAMLDPANAHAISAELDPFWHAHMLFSNEYMSFCNDVVGEYMHHVPLSHDNLVEVGRVKMLYGYTISTLKTWHNTQIPWLFSKESTAKHITNQKAFKGFFCFVVVQ